MAVVQISRIQIRRGKANAGTGFPQLASGELGWALDTQELYIGSGSVAEGSPAVGNTKILTENDLVAQGNLLNLLQHIYKANDPEIITGDNANYPTTRYVQDRLDDRVTASDFGAIGNDTDNTKQLQRAIDQLFLNPNSKSSETSADGVRTRVVLELPPGIFRTSSSLFIPSYASIIGAGPDKTIINFNPVHTITASTTISQALVTSVDANTNMIGSSITGAGIPSNTTIVDAENGVSITLNHNATATATDITLTITSAGPAIQFINDSSDIADPSTINSTLWNNQPRNIILKGLTISTTSGSQTCVQLDAVKDSTFEDINIRGNWGLVQNNNSKGIALNALSDIVTCENNVFRRINISGFNFSIYAKQDIQNNLFDSLFVNDARVGIALGLGANASTIGQKYGPRNTTISNSYFTDIQRQAVYIDLGANNTISNCKLSYVGNDGGDHSSIKYPQIYLGRFHQGYAIGSNNVAQNITSDRTIDLSDVGYHSSKVQLTLSQNITAEKGTYVYQAYTEAYGYLLEDAVDTNVITLYDIETPYVEITPGNFGYISKFDDSNFLTIAGDTSPGPGNTNIYPTVVGSAIVDLYINYIPEVTGYGTYTVTAQQQQTLEHSTSKSAFRLPVKTDANGDPIEAISYTISYFCRNDTSFNRRGIMQLTASMNDGTIHFVDEYDHLGNDNDILNLIFSARLLDEDGSEYTGALGQTPFAIEVRYSNSADAGGVFAYTYTSIF